MVAVEFCVKWNMLTNYFRAQQFIKPAAGVPEEKPKHGSKFSIEQLKLSSKSFPFAFETDLVSPHKSSSRRSYK